MTTQNDIGTMRRQLRRLGLGHDTRREIATTDDSYYRWTQWIFLQIFNSWADGRSDVGNYPVHRRPLRQWMLRITSFAERLIDDLDLVDWPESIKQMQRNWIGASDGAHIDLRAAGHPEISIEVFTTRPDTLFGATYVVLAPEHPLVDQLIPDAWPEGAPEAWRYPQGRDGAVAWSPRDAVAAYQGMAGRLSDRQRTAEAYDKTGVFTGTYAINPITEERIPVFLADYVLMGYGTGAIMAVPAHDQRDLDFAHEFGLDIRKVLEPPAAWLAEHGTDETTSAGQWQTAFAGDGAYVEAPGPELAGLGKRDGIVAAIGWLEEKGAGRGTRSYRLRDWLFSRQRYWGEPFPIVYDEHGLPIALPEDMLPVRLPEMTDFRSEPQEDQTGEPVPPLAKARKWATVELDLGDGPKRYRRELNTMPQWAGSCSGCGAV